MRPLATLQLRTGRFVLRRSDVGDLPDLVALLAADQLGASRDGIATQEDLEAYQRAFAMIDQDPAQLLIAAVSPEDRVVGTLQLSFIPGLARRGALRGQIEAVRVAADLRGSGLGTQMLQWSIDEARRRGCTLVQLTTDKARTDAFRFYQRLGFTASHEGMKLRL
jgi:GNAT superfamily N-acetyltransferase